MKTKIVYREGKYGNFKYIEQVIDGDLPDLSSYQHIMKGDRMYKMIGKVYDIVSSETSVIVDSIDGSLERDLVRCIRGS